MKIELLLSHVHTELRQHQMEALVSFLTWFVERHGERSEKLWKSMVLLRMINAHDEIAAGRELLNWIWTDERIDDTLVRRRIRELMLWEGVSNGHV